MRDLLSVLIAGAILTAPVVSRAQSAADFPNRPIRLVVGFAPGGATDTLARLLTGALGQELGQTIYVENIAGASGLLGWRNVAAATPDGYTLLMAENAVAIRPGFKDMTPTFDPVTQLEAVASVAHSPLALCVAGNVPANNIKELIALSRSTDKKLNYASAGSGSVAQLVWEVVKDGAKIEAVNVPYRGGGPAMAAIIAGQVDMIMASSQVAKPLVEDKRIKALAVTGKQRSPALPDVPTLAEAGIQTADVDLQFWFGVFGPKGLPADVKGKLEKAIQKALQSPAVRERLAVLDITPEFGPGAVLLTLLQNEIKNWKTFIEAKGLTAN
ncbi:MAG: tripartite tricarboxylate transporter substrate binding protein [Rhizobiales bacterium]|nr:tripartite tricarboxylate transporter substrate binding protein [Hyphomicrobiales bacterium]